MVSLYRYLFNDGPRKFNSSLFFFFYILKFVREEKILRVGHRVNIEIKIMSKIIFVTILKKKKKKLNSN